MRLWLLATLLAWCEPAAAADFDASAKGTTTADFLRMGAGARGAAMGEAFSATVDDATSLYWNPAALTRISSRSAAFMHATHLESSFFDYLAYGAKLGRSSAWGVSAQYFSAGSIPETDISGSSLGQFSPHDLAVSAGYAREAAGFSLGASGKFLRSTVLGSAQAFAVDFGILSPAMAGERLRMAFTASNIGGRMKFDADSESLPLVYKLGAALRLSSSWLVTGEAAAPRNNAPFLSAGTEYALITGQNLRVMGRAGYNGRNGQDTPGFAGASFGLGLGYGSLQLDYAVVPFGVLGLARRLSLSWSWQ